MADWIKEKTNLDEIIDYPQLIISRLADSPAIRDLLADTTNATVEDIEDKNGGYKYIYDYDYVDDTTQDTRAYICLESYVDEVDNDHILSMVINVNVICHKQYMKLNHKTFKGLKGNRKDNLIRHIDKLLNGTRIGIGRLELVDVKPLNVPQNYTGLVSIYRLYDFNRTTNNE